MSINDLWESTAFEECQWRKQRLTRLWHFIISGTVKWYIWQRQFVVFSIQPFHTTSWWGEIRARDSIYLFVIVLQMLNEKKKANIGAFELIDFQILYWTLDYLK